MCKYPTQPNPVPNDSTPIWDLVISDMKARDNLGRERYGVPLQANNGRDSLRDLYEEELDKIVYLKQFIIEQKRIIDVLKYYSKSSDPNKALEVLNDLGQL